MNNIYKKNKRKAGRIKIRYDEYEYIRNFKKENFTNWNKTMSGSWITSVYNSFRRIKSEDE